MSSTVDTRRVWISGVILVALVGLIVAHTAVLRFALNRFALADSGVQVVSAERLAIDPLAVFRGSIAFSGRDVVLRHALVPQTVALASIDGTAPLDGSRLGAAFRIGAYPGRLALVRRDGQLTAVDAIIGHAGSSSMRVQFRRLPDGTPTLRARGRALAPLLAVALERQGEDARGDDTRGKGAQDKDTGSLPDTVDVALVQSTDRRLTLRYAIDGRRVAIAGRGAIDLDARKLVHDGRLRLVAAPRRDTKDSDDTYGALQGQLDLVVNRIAPMLRRFAVNSRFDMTFVSPSDTERYGVTVVSGGRATGPIGRVLIATSGADVAAVPRSPLLDIAIDDEGRSRGHLLLTGRMLAFDRPLPVRMTLDGGAGAGDRIDAATIDVARRGSAGLLLTVAFVDPLIGGNARLDIKAAGSVQAVGAGPSTPQSLVGVLDILRASNPAGSAIAMSGGVSLTPGVSTFDDLSVALGGDRVTVDGTIGQPKSALAVDVALARLDQATIARLQAAAARSPAGSSGTTPRIVLHARIGRFAFGRITTDGLELDFDATSKAVLKFASLHVGGKPTASDGRFTLPMPLAAGARATGGADSPWGAITASYRPNDTRDFAAIMRSGGAIAIGLPGGVANATLPAGQDRPIHVTAKFANPGEAAVLKSVMGDTIRYLPDGPLSIAAQVTRGGVVQAVALDAGGIQMRARAQGGHGLAVALSGRSRTMFARVPDAARMLTSDQPVTARFSWRQQGASHALDDLEAAIGDLRLRGSARLQGSQMSGRFLVRADRVRAASLLVPGLVGMLPNELLDVPLVMPIDIRSNAGAVTLAMREASVGPLSISSDLAARGTDGEMAGSIAIAGPIADTLLRTLPAWIRDVLGNRQRLVAQAVVSPQTAILVRGLKIEGGGVTLAGDLTVPMRGGAFQWDGVSGKLSGGLVGARYGAFSVPVARYHAVLDEDRRASARIDFDMAGNGTVAMQLGLDRRAGGLGDGRVELTAHGVDLASVCRTTGFGLFGAGTLDASLTGSVPAAVFAGAADGQALLDTIMRQIVAGGRLSIDDGALLDIDLAARARDADGGVGVGERTPFSEISSDLTLTGGSLRLSNGRFVTPQYALDIAGSVQMPVMVLDVTVKGQVVVLSRISTGAAVMRAPIPPLHIAGRAGDPRFEFVPGTARVTSVAMAGVKIVSSVSAGLAKQQAKTDKFFSDKFFRPLIGKKAPPAPVPADTRAAAPGIAESPARASGTRHCG